MAQQKYPKYSKPRQALAQFIHATCSMGRVSEDGVGRFCSFLLMATEFFICQFYAVERQLASYSPQITLNALGHPLATDVTCTVRQTQHRAWVRASWLHP